MLYPPTRHAPALQISRTLLYPPYKHNRITFNLMTQNLDRLTSDYTGLKLHFILLCKSST